MGNHYAMFLACSHLQAQQPRCPCEPERHCHRGRILLHHLRQLRCRRRCRRSSSSRSSSRRRRRPVLALLRLARCCLLLSSCSAAVNAAAAAAAAADVAAADASAQAVAGQCILTPAHDPPPTTHLHLSLALLDKSCH